MSKSLLIKCEVIIPRIHVASNERGVDGKAFDFGLVGFHEFAETTGLVQAQKLLSKTEIHEDWVAATVLPGWDYDPGAVLPLCDQF